MAKYKYSIKNRFNDIDVLMNKFKKALSVRKWNVECDVENKKYNITCIYEYDLKERACSNFEFSLLDDFDVDVAYETLFPKFKFVVACKCIEKFYSELDVINVDVEHDMDTLETCYWFQTKEDLYRVCFRKYTKEYMEGLRDETENMKRRREQNEH